MSDVPGNENGLPEAAETGGGENIQDRRRFLQGMGKWSGAAIGAAVTGAWLASSSEARAGAWVNRRVGGGGWINGGGGAWVNRRVGGGSWVNRR